MFLTTLSFVITTPGVWQAGYGFPALSASPGQFLVKDVVLLGAAISTLVDSLRCVVSRPTEVAALIEQAASYSR
jgi:uncharacterized membrane protein YkgB